MIEYFPDPYPNEILYSVWARTSECARYMSREDAMSELFGNKYAHPMIELPCHLGYFVANLPYGHSYTVDALINQHTLFPLYAPFLSHDRLSRLRELMILGNARVVHRLVGSLKGALAESTPCLLRYCPMCVDEDRTLFGECYWHRLHQVKGVEVCPQHNTFLENSTVQMRNHMGIEERQLISAEHAIHDRSRRIIQPSAVNDILIDIAKVISILLENPYRHTDGHFLRKQYSALLAKRGLLTLQGSVRSEDLVKSFIEYYPPQLLTLLHCEIDHVHKPALSWLSTLMHPENNIRHPLHHILAICFLGTTVETFLTQGFLPSRLFGEGPWPCLNPVCEGYHQRRIFTCQIHEKNGKGLIVGKFTCSCGFAYSRSGPDRVAEDAFRKDNILTYGPLWEARLSKLWLDQTVKIQDIAAQLGVATGTVHRRAAKLHLLVPRTSLWSGRSGLKYIRKNAKERSWYETQWLALVDANPEASTAVLRKRLPGVHWWLNTHNKEWLMAHLPPSRERRKPNFWLTERESIFQDTMWDEKLASKVRACAQKIIDNPDYPKKVTARKIGLNVLELKRVQRYQAPATRLALQEVVESPEIFAMRRIQWFVHKCQKERICPKRKEFIRSTSIEHVLRSPIVLHAFDEAMTVLAQFA